MQGLADMDSRLAKLNSHVIELEEAIDSRPPPPSTPPPNFIQNDPPPSNNSEDYERLNKRVDRAYKWQEGAEKTLRDLSTKLQPLHSEVKTDRNLSRNLLLGNFSDNF